MSEYAPAIEDELGTEVLRRLASADSSVRRIALREISDHADEFPEIFVGAAADADAGVRREAAQALEATVDAAAIGALVGLLGDDDAGVAATAALSLGEILDPVAAPVLLQHLHRATGSARAALLSGLRQLRYAPVLAPALASLDDPLPAVRRAAVGVLAYLHLPTALPGLARLAQHDQEAEVRRAAVAALSFASPEAGPDVLPALQAALGDADWQVRQEAAQTLTRLRWSPSAPVLIATLQDNAWEVRQKAAHALGVMRSSEAVGALVGQLDHPISNVRKEVAAALGAIGDPSAAPALQARLQDTDIDVRKTAARALTLLGQAS